MWKIRKELLKEILIAAKNSHPKEFLCFLGGNKKNENVEEFVFIPNETNNHSASVYENSTPFDETIVGTVHSHPNSTNRPSGADKKMFQKYKINLILGYPFEFEQIGAYDEKSVQIPIELI